MIVYLNNIFKSSFKRDKSWINLTSNKYLQLVTQEENWIKYKNLFRKLIRKSMKFGKYLGCVLSLKAYSQIGNVISDNNLGLNLLFFFYFLESMIYYMGHKGRLWQLLHNYMKR